MLFAALLMGAFALLGAATGRAQDTTPLVATTGPNVLGQGRIQWNSQFEYMHWAWKGMLGSKSGHNLGTATGLRFGIGNRAELTLDLAGSYSTTNDLFGFTPAVGAKLQLFDGRGWLPQTAFFTHISAPSSQDAYSREWRPSYLQPEIGLQFRNRVGGRFLIDYSLGYMWNLYSSSNSIDPVNQLQYSLAGRWLATDCLMLGLGISNRNIFHETAADMELRYQASPSLQLSLSASVQAGASDYGLDATDEIHALAGISWMLK